MLGDSSPRRRSAGQQRSQPAWLRTRLNFLLFLALGGPTSNTRPSLSDLEVSFDSRPGQSRSSTAPSFTSDGDHAKTRHPIFYSRHLTWLSQREGSSRGPWHGWPALPLVSA